MTDSSHLKPLALLLSYLKDGQPQVILDSLASRGPATESEAWLLYLAHRVLGHYTEAIGIAKEHVLVEPPEELVDAVVQHYQKTGDAQLLSSVLMGQQDQAARAATLKAVLEPEWNATPNLTLLSLLLEAQVLTGDVEGVERTVSQGNLHLEGNGHGVLRAIVSVTALSSEGASYDQARLAVEALGSVDGHQLVALRLLLASAALNLGDDQAAQSLARAAFDEVQSDLMWFSVEPVVFTTSDTSGEQQYGVQVFAPSSWPKVLDTFITNEGWPADLRGQALLLRASLQDLAPQEDVRQAREFLGDTVWVRKLTVPEHPLAYLQNFKAWTSAYMAEHGPVYVDWPVIPPLPDGASFTREEALTFHQELLDWTEDYDASEGEHGAIGQARLTAWRSGAWAAGLKQYDLHAEMSEAAQAVLELVEDTSALFALGYHGTQTRDPGWLTEAVTAYERYLEIYPENQGVLNNLGYTIETMGDLTRAEQLYMQALNLEPDDEMVIRNLSRVRLALQVRAIQPYGIDLRFKQKALTEERTFALAYWSRTELGWKSTAKELTASSGLTPARQRERANAAAWSCSTTLICQDCSTPYVYHDRKDFEDRTRFGSTRSGASTAPYLCPDCTTKRTAAARVEQVATQSRQREIVQSMFDLTEVPALDPEAFTLEDAVYLVSLVRAGATEDLRTIEALSTFRSTLAATPDFALDMVKHLHQRNLLRIHPASVPEAFDWEGEKITAFDLTKVRWGIPVGGQQLPFGVFVGGLEARLGAGPDAWSDAWKQEVPALWRKVILSEAVRHLLHCLAQHKFSFSPGEKTLMVLTAVLEKYSLGQVWNIIWSRAKDTAAYYTRERVSKEQAANSTISRIKGYAENAKANGWNIRAARRDFDTPMPTVSQVLFVHSLQRGFQYQEELPPPLEQTE